MLKKIIYMNAILYGFASSPVSSSLRQEDEQRSGEGTAHLERIFKKQARESYFNANYKEELNLKRQLYDLNPSIENAESLGVCYASQQDYHSAWCLYYGLSQRFEKKSEKEQHYQTLATRMFELERQERSHRLSQQAILNYRAKHPLRTFLNDFFYRFGQ